MYQPTLLPAAKLKRLLQILEGIKAGSTEGGKEEEKREEHKKGKKITKRQEIRVLF